MKRVAVIGSNSFSGSDFIAHLLQQGGHDILGISRREEKDPLFLPYKKLNCSSFSFLQRDCNTDLEELLSDLYAFQPEYIVNFAAQSEVAPSWQWPEQWFQTNVVAITALANALVKAKWLKRYVHISSPEIYRSCKGVVTENAPFCPSTPYAASKAAGDLSLQTFFKQYRFPLITICATNVYGPCQQLFKIIPRTMIYQKLGKKVSLHGGGKAIKSYIYIRDVSIGTQLAMEKVEIGQVYHLSPDSGVSVREVVEKIASLANTDPTKLIEDVEERPGQDAAYVIDSSKIRNRLCWQRKVSLSEGLFSTLQWIEQSWEGTQSQSLSYTHVP